MIAFPSPRTRLQLLRVFRELVTITVGGFAVGLAVRHFVFTTDSPPLPEQMVGRLSPGSRLELPADAFKNSARTVVLATTPTCSYCVQSKPFHRQLDAVCARAGVPLIVVVSNVKNSRGYLRDLNLRHAKVLQEDLARLGIPGTPCLLLVDDQRTVTNLWLGRLSPEAERSVVVSVESSGLTSGPSTVRNTHEAHSVSSDGELVIDVRQRDEYSRLHSPNVTNIPLDELPTRARVELSVDRPVSLDCSYTSKPTCYGAARILNNSGFSKVSFHNLGASDIACDSCRMAQTTHSVDQEGDTFLRGGR